MKSFCRHILSLLVLVVYLVGSSFIELTHHDGASVQLHSDPTLSSHECGAKERHVPLDEARHCLACSQSGQRVSTPASESATFSPPVVFTVVRDHRAEQLFEADVFHSGKRGPPSA